MEFLTKNQEMEATLIRNVTFLTQNQNPALVASLQNQMQKQEQEHAKEMQHLKMEMQHLKMEMHHLKLDMVQVKKEVIRLIKTAAFLTQRLSLLHWGPGAV